MRRVLSLLGLMMTVVLGAGVQPCRADAFWGGVLGGSLGGYIGSTIGHGDGRAVATGIGVATGMVLGSQIGASMDRPSSYGAGSVVYAAPVPYVYPAYRPTYVAPPDPPTQVVYVTQPVYVTGGYVGGAYTRECRPYAQTVRIGNTFRTTQGMACLQPDGTWLAQ
jgi:surface antigen